MSSRMRVVTASRDGRLGRGKGVRIVQRADLDAPLIRVARQLRVTGADVGCGIDLVVLAEEIDGGAGKAAARHDRFREQAVQLARVVLRPGNAMRSSPLDPLRRRWIATLHSGFAAQGQHKAESLARELSSLARSGFTTAAELLDALSHISTGKEHDYIDTFLATAVYLRCCGFELARQVQISSS
jgi:hypothetical protein